jgi:8-oxo-dGTP diphosphatase
MKSPYYRVSVKGIVVDSEKRILLSLEENGKWEMLGGGLEHGEDYKSCLKREIKEEAGLDITYIEPSPSYFLTSKREDRPEEYVANIIYKIELANLNFTPSDECQELRFFSLDEIKKLDLFPNVRQLIKVLESEA